MADQAMDTERLARVRACVDLYGQLTRADLKFLLEQAERHALGPANGGDLVFELSDKTGEPRTASALASLAADLRETLAAYGYKWRTHGTRLQMRQLYAKEQARLDAEDTREMLEAFRRGRDE